MKQPIFSGIGTAIITPFTEDGIDMPALKQLVTMQLAAGVHAIIVCGTTGEAATQSYGERIAVIETVTETVNGKIPVIAGTGSNHTKTAITLSKDAVKAGADGILVVTPYYNKAAPEGLFAHFSAIADSVACPMVLYNVPSRTGVAMTAKDYEKLSHHPNIIGVKEASGSLSLVQETLDTCPKDFYVWSGNDEDTAAIAMLGGQGVISVAANLVPERMVALWKACQKNDFSTAGILQLSLRRLNKALFSTVNPIPVKTALSGKGLCKELFRLPLSPMPSSEKEKLFEILKKEKIL